MRSTQLLLCLLGISTAFFNHVETRSARSLEGEGIMGGDDAKDGQFPYQISLQAPWRFVITAAHCVISKDNVFKGYPMKVVAGISDLKSRSKSREAIDVAEVFVPEEYDAEAVWYNHRNGGDIAILKLSKSLNLEGNSKLGKVRLPKKDETYEGKKATVSGFGWNYVELVTNPRTGEYKEVNGQDYGKLRFAEANVLSHDYCRDIHSPRLPIIKSQICAGLVQREEDEPEGVCRGDSGGPLVYEGTQIGVVSTSPWGCLENKKPAVYTRVSNYLDFINKVVEGMTDESIRSTTYHLPRSKSPLRGSNS